VSFQEPWRLVFIVAPIALLIAYIVVQRMRSKYAMRFTSVDLLASVAPRRAGWQRHISALLMLAAVVLLVVGFAKPTTTVKTPKKDGTIMLTIDTSGSMAATDVSPSRLAAAQASAKQFVAKLPPGLKVGLVSFGSTSSLKVSPTSDRAAVESAIDNLTVGGGTATGTAMMNALDAVKSLPADANGKKPAAAIVLMSDGSPTIGANGETPQQSVADAVKAAVAAKVPVNTIAYGTPNGTVQTGGEIVPVPADPQAMADIAKGTKGKSFTAKSASELSSVYEQIRKSVGYDSHQRDITAAFTGLGLLAGVLAAAAALFWMQRIL
jgi:Ca-activated chloride channel family protein